MKTSEPHCVAMKRRGAEHVAAETAGLSGTEEMEYWRRRSEQLRALKQSIADRAEPAPSPPSPSFQATAEGTGGASP